MRIGSIQIGRLKNVSELDEKLAVQMFSRRIIDSRSKFKIAVIDDEDFSPLESLRHHHYNIMPFRDVQSVESLERYQIILCDLIGVGTALSATLQGAEIISELKKNYPEKMVVVYTGGGKPELLARSLPVADKYLPKDASVEQWCDVLDRAIQDLANPAIVWRKLRHKLLDVDVSPYQLAQLEDVFVRKALKGEDFSMDVVAMTTTEFKLPRAAKTILEHVAFHLSFEVAKAILKGAAE